MKSVINIVDAMMISTSVPNIIALYILAPEIKSELKKYCLKLKLKTPFDKVWKTEVERKSTQKQIVVPK